MAKPKEAVEEIVIGEFVQMARDGNAEVRLRDARNANSLCSMLSRNNSANKKVEPGASYEMVLRKVKDAPDVATVQVTMRAEDVGSLPNDAVIEKSEAKAGVSSSDQSGTQPIP